MPTQHALQFDGRPVCSRTQTSAEQRDERRGGVCQNGTQAGHAELEARGVCPATSGRVAAPRCMPVAGMRVRSCEDTVSRGECNTSTKHYQVAQATLRPRWRTPLALSCCMRNWRGRVSLPPFPLTAEWRCQHSLRAGWLSINFRLLCRCVVACLGEGQ